VRVDLDQIAGVPATARPVTPPPSRSRPRERGRVDWFELAVIVVFSAVSLWVLVLDLGRVIFDGRVWTGTDGVYIVDQMQYLAWIRDASQHFLISNQFVLHGTPHDYFQPLFVISGGLTALGMTPWLSLLLWKPVAVGAILLVVRQYIHRSLEGRWPRRVALVLALFFGSFTLVLGAWTVLGDLFPGFLSWGYVIALLGLASMTGAVLSYDRAWSRGAVSWWPGVLGAFASLMHPWNGELAIAVIVGTELLVRLGSGRLLALRLRSNRSADLGSGEPAESPTRGGYVSLLRPPRGLRLAAVTVILTGLPLLYYAVLGKTDPSWELARGASKHSFPLWAIALAVVPLLLPALLAYRQPPRTFLAAATRCWPIAAVAIYVLSASAAGATPLHAFQGITIPLTVLAVQGAQLAGWRRLPHSALLTVVAVAVLTIPATLEELRLAGDLSAPTSGNANFITHDERRALDFLASDRTPGGVLAEPYLGAAVPGETGRRSYDGDCLWSEPDCYGRTNRTRALFGGSMSSAEAREFVLGTPARFVLADCQSRADLPKLLGPTVTSIHRFGCAAVYEVR
jgi:hypothetical protein